MRDNALVIAQEALLPRSLAAIAFLAPDYDVAIAWFRDTLGLSVLEDVALGAGKRWIVVGERGAQGARIVLAKADGDRQTAAIGAATGGRVGYFLETDDFARDHARFLALGVEFLEAPRHEGYGIVAVFADPWGGKWDLIQPRRIASALSFERQAAIWGLVLIALMGVLSTLGSTIAPFACGLALGYLLNPVVNYLHRFGLGRLASAVVILLVFMLALTLLAVTVAPVLAHQLADFSSKLPQYVTTLQDLAVKESASLEARYGGEFLRPLGLGDRFTPEQIQKSISNLINQSGAWLLSGVQKLALGGAALLSFLTFLIVTPVVAFYLLVDWHRMLDTVDSWLPLDHRDDLRQIAREIDGALAGFLRGQSLVCVFLGCWYGLGLTFVGLDFGLLIGVLGGVLGFIPYVGSFTVLVLSLGVAIVQGWPSFTMFLLAFAVVGAGQFLEGYVISPKLIGESIGLHPVWLIFALFAFGALYGFTGLIVAVPAAAAIGVIVRHLLRLYRRSAFYRGRAAIEVAP